MNPRSELFGLIWIKNSVYIILTSDSFELRTSFELIRIRTLGLSRIKSDWIFVRIKNLGLTWIEMDWFLTDLHQTRLKNFLHWFRWVRIGLGQISEWIGKNLIGSEWISIRNFHQRSLAEKFVRIFSEMLSEFVLIFTAFSERWQSNSKKF